MDFEHIIDMSDVPEGAEAVSLMYSLSDDFWAIDLVTGVTVLWPRGEYREKHIGEYIVLFDPDKHGGWEKAEARAKYKSDKTGEFGVWLDKPGYRITTPATYGVFEEHEMDEDEIIYRQTLRLEGEDIEMDDKEVKYWLTHDPNDPEGIVPGREE